MGLTITIQRETPDKLSDFQGEVVNFQDGSILTGADLNRGVTGLLHNVQEIGDLANQPIGPGEIEGYMLADGCVTEPKIADLAVSTRTIISNAVTNEKLGASAVTTAKIANDAVTYAKIQNVEGNRILCNATPSSGDVGEIPCTAFGRQLVNIDNAEALRGLLFDDAGPYTLFGNLSSQAADAGLEPINQPCGELLKAPTTDPPAIRTNFVTVARQNRTWVTNAGPAQDSWASDVVSSQTMSGVQEGLGLHYPIDSGIAIPIGCRKFSVSFFYETANAQQADPLYQNGWVYGLYLNGGSGGQISQAPVVNIGRDDGTKNRFLGSTGHVTGDGQGTGTGGTPQNSQDEWMEFGVVRRGTGSCPVFRNRALYSGRALMLMNSFSFNMMSNHEYGTLGQYNLAPSLNIPKWTNDPTSQGLPGTTNNFRVFGQADFVAVTNNRDWWQFKSHSILDIQNFALIASGNYSILQAMHTQDDPNEPIKPLLGKVVTNTGVVHVPVSGTNPDATTIYLNGGFRRVYTLVVSGSAVASPVGPGYYTYDNLHTNADNANIYSAATASGMTVMGTGAGQFGTSSFNVCSLCCSFDI